MSLEENFQKILQEGNRNVTITGQGVFIPLQKGDVVLTGRFKNKKEKVKEISINSHGGLQINGRNVLRFRYHKTRQEVMAEEGEEDES